MSASAPPPERLTIATCIGCGAMSVPSGCPGGCGPERKLELVAGAELDGLIDLEQQSGRRTEALSEVLTHFLTQASGGPATELRVLARAALRLHEHECPAATEALAVEPEPVVSWWCEQCGGLDAPAPCVGVCIRRPAQWATLNALQRQRAAAADALQRERRLARAVRALVLTRPRPGSELRHWRALRQASEQALAAQRQSRPTAPIEGAEKHYGTGVVVAEETAAAARAQRQPSDRLHRTTERVCAQTPMGSCCRGRTLEAAHQTKD